MAAGFGGNDAARAPPEISGQDKVRKRTRRGIQYVEHTGGDGAGPASGILHHPSAQDVNRVPPFCVK